VKDKNLLKNAKILKDITGPLILFFYLAKWDCKTTVLAFQKYFLFGHKPICRPWDFYHYNYIFAIASWTTKLHIPSVPIKPFTGYFNQSKDMTINFHSTVL